MNPIPWWAYSPSPMTLAFYSVLAFYGAYKLRSHGLRQWLGNFAESAFLIGLVILPHDSSWMILQWLKWGFLYPNEYIMVINVLIRNGLIFSLCLLSSWKLSGRVNVLRLRNNFFVLFPIIVLVVKFLFAPDPVWTDYTYGMRFEVNSPWLLAYLSGLPDKVSLGFIYVALWKGNFLNGRR